MSPPPGLSRSMRVYAALLRLYPAGFRNRFQDDAVELFHDRYTEAYRRRGRAGLVALWLKTVPNVMVHGLLERAAGAWGRRASSEASGTLTGAARRLARAPGTSALVVATLGVGIGANVALFSVVRGVLIRPLPYAEPDRLVRLWESNPAVDAEPHGPSPWNFADWDGRLASFESMAAWYLTSGTHRTEDAAEEVRSAQVTADFFHVLRARPALGALPRAEELGGYGPLLLSHRLWQRLYGGDPSIVGRSVVVSDERYVVAGIMPPDFSFPEAGVESWLVWDLPSVYADRPEARSWRFLDGMARLAPGVSVEEAEDELDALAEALAEAFPEANRGWGTDVTPLRDEVVGSVAPTLWTAFGVVLLILAVACANVANLLLSRVPARAREVAIRTTLGASRARITADLLSEALLMAAVSGVLGLALGAALLDGLVALDAGRIPRLGEVEMDGWVLGFASSVTLLTSVLFGLAPALAAMDASAFGSLRDGVRSTSGAGAGRLRDVFVAGQVGVALVLLTGAGLFAASFQRLWAVDPGFDPYGAATFRVSLDPVDAAPGATARYYEALLERIEAVPGVAVAGAAQTLPLNPVGNDFRRPYRAPGSATEVADAPAAQMRIVTPGYFAAMRMRFVDGSSFDGTEAAGEPLVAIVNRTLAARLWPRGGAVGESLEVEFRGGWQPYRVVGVVEDVRHYGLREAARAELFVAHRQVPYLAMTVVARTGGDPGAVMEALRTTVLDVPPGQPGHDFSSLERLRSASVAEERFLAVLVGVFSAIALLLAGSGVYGVIAQSVGQRRREIGVRMALGARATTVVAEVLKRTLTLAALGVGVGLVASRLLGRSVDRLLYEVGPNDLTITLGVAAFTLAVAALAGAVPARRAARVSPVVALRAD